MWDINNQQFQLDTTDTSRYLQQVLAGNSPVAERETLPPIDAARERLVLGLRRLSGVSPTTFRRETGFSIEQLAGKVIREFAQLGLLECGSDRVCLTRKGLLVSDSMWEKILSP